MVCCKMIKNNFTNILFQFRFCSNFQVHDRDFKGRVQHSFSVFFQAEQVTSFLKDMAKYTFTKTKKNLKTN